MASAEFPELRVELRTELRAEPLAELRVEPLVELYMGLYKVNYRV